MNESSYSTAWYIIGSAALIVAIIGGLDTENWSSGVHAATREMQAAHFIQAPSVHEVVLRCWLHYEISWCMCVRARARSGFKKRISSYYNVSEMHGTTVQL